MGHEQRPPAFGRLASPACPHRRRPGPRQGLGSIRVGEPLHHQPHRAQPGGDVDLLVGGLRAGGQLAGQLQRPFELFIGGFVGQLGGGLLAGPQQVRQGPRGADHRGGLPAVIGHLGRRLRLGTPHRHQGVDDPRVQAGAAGAADVLIDRLPHQRVREPVPACRPVVLDDQPGQHGRFGGIQRGFVLQPGHRFDQVQVEPAAGHGGDHQQGAGLRGQPGQPRAQHVPHPHRNVPPRRRRRVRPRPACVRFAAAAAVR